MNTRLILAPLILALLSAGCAAKEETPPEEPAAPSEDAPLTEASVPDEPPAETVPNATAPVEVPLRYEGSLGIRLVACSVPLVCIYQSITPDDRFFVPDLGGLPLALSLTLTWSAETPNTERLRLGYERCSGSCEDGDTEIVGTVSGPSPLVLDVEDLEWTKGDELRLFVWLPPQVSTGDNYAFLSTDQPFLLEGTILTKSG